MTRGEMRFTRSKERQQEVEMAMVERPSTVVAMTLKEKLAEQRKALRNFSSYYQY